MDDLDFEQLEDDFEHDDSRNEPFYQHSYNVLSERTTILILSAEITP